MLPTALESVSMQLQKNRCCSRVVWMIPEHSVSDPEADCQGRASSSVQRPERALSPIITWYYTVISTKTSHIELATTLSVRQQWLLGVFDGLIALTMLRVSVQNIMLGDEDDVEKDADVSKP
jgi:hypothetical protein